ncbi:hypothetical protein DNTS_012444 [Danionella cerebrum]|uniref:Alpha-mannosidase n=1 Tax=Danionella cerebrum TaxID=2873325 RepID=A0A553QPA6_9TELE|nr:hypothetical protein DNTS_012444 [Danionella translucida]
MLTKLYEDERRKFIWCEISYFSKWWDGIDEQKRDAVRRLVERGQLEVATGGWVMADEANSHYFALIDQLIEGHQWLESNLGVKPRTGWAVDPFGYSPTHTYLLSQAGLSNMLIQRVHYSVKKYLSSQKSLEFLWRQNWDQGSSSDILCHMMPFYSYDIPHTCGPDPKICCQFDFKRLPGGKISCPWGIPPQAITDSNIQERAHTLLDQYRKKSQLFRTSVLMIPLGDDFRYSESIEWDQQFGNYQKLFDYMNSHPELHVKAQFGTISDYFEALRKSTGMDPVSMDIGKLALPVLSGDFFTYADRDDHYWSGYFTSRPFYKHLDRVLESLLRAAEVLYSLTLAGVQNSVHSGSFPSIENYNLLTEARRNLGLFQHHDAITGTATDWVVVDYGTRLLQSVLNVKRVISSSAHWLVLQDKQMFSYNPSKPFLQMDDVPPAQDALPQKNVIDVRAKPRKSLVSVYVNTPDVRVLDAQGHVVHAQISAVWIDANRPSANSFQLSFLAHTAPLALSIFQLKEGLPPRSEVSRYMFFQDGRQLSELNLEHFPSLYQQDGAPLLLENSHLRLSFSADTGLLQKMMLKEEEKEQQVKVEFVWYGTTSNKDKSGAYLFLPDGEATVYSPSQAPLVRVTKGPLFSEVTTSFTNIIHTLRLYSVHGVESQSVEIWNTVDIRGEYNREIAMRISSDLHSGDVFFTDLNGYQIQQRRTLAKLPLQANFYPMSSMSYLQEPSIRLSLLSAQAHAVASLQSGQLEVIMDRRLNQDDNRGLGQGVLDNKITANSFRLLLEQRSPSPQNAETAPYSYPSILSHMTYMYLNHPLIPMAITQQADSPSVAPYLPVNAPFPCDMHLVNLRTIQAQEGKPGPSDQAALILHRKGFDCGFSNRNTGLLCTGTHGKIDLQELLTNLKIRSITPVSLTLMHTHNKEANQQEVSLKPMEIRTFRLQLI